MDLDKIVLTLERVVNYIPRKGGSIAQENIGKSLYPLGIAAGYVADIAVARFAPFVGGPMVAAAVLVGAPVLAMYRYMRETR